MTHSVHHVAHTEGELSVTEVEKIEQEYADGLYCIQQHWNGLVAHHEPRPVVLAAVRVAMLLLLLLLLLLVPVVHRPPVIDVIGSEAVFWVVDPLVEQQQVL